MANFAQNHTAGKDKAPPRSAGLFLIIIIEKHSY